MFQSSPSVDVSAKDATGKTALHYCADHSNKDAVELLLSVDKSLVDVQDNSGHTALHLASVAGSVPVVKSLLSRGADPNLRDNEEHCSAHWATGLTYKSIG